MNRSEWMANKYKTDPSAFLWVPEVMTSIDPSPSYHNPGYPKTGGLRLTAKRRSLEGAAAFRQSLTNIQQKQEKSRVGRLYQHFHLIQMRKDIKLARTYEGKYDPEAGLDPSDKAKAILRGEKKDALPDVKIEDNFNLPFGFGYDNIIKERADMINDKKFLNNQVMDTLVEQLGYLDYRDALAANKYILETRRHQDYK